MLRRIKIDGYKGLRGTDLTLAQEGLTVLLGPNGSGKSSLFGALQLAYELSAEEVGRTHLGGRFADFVEHGDIRQPIGLEVEYDAPPDGATVWRIRIGMNYSSLHIQEEGFLRDRNLISRYQDRGIVLHEEPLRSSKVPSERPIKFSLAPTESLCRHARQYPGTRDGSDNDVWWNLADALNESLGSVRIARLNPVRLAMPVPLNQQVAADGYGLAAQLLHLSSTRRKVFAEIQDRFCALFPWVEEIELPTLARAIERPEDGGLQGLQGFQELEAAILQEPQGFQGRTAGSSTVSHVELRFREKGVGRSYPAREMASGMLLALALLWMAHRPDADRILCFDEPENSVHPYLLGFVYQLLKGLTKSQAGRPPVQVVVATHSVDFVDLCEPEEVRVCERRDDGGVRVRSIRDQQDLAAAVDNYRGAMGELWLSGALGGFPAHAPSRSGSR